MDRLKPLIWRAQRVIPVSLLGVLLVLPVAGLTYALNQAGKVDLDSLGRERSLFRVEVRAMEQQYKAFMARQEELRAGGSGQSLPTKDLVELYLLYGCGLYEGEFTMNQQSGQLRVTISAPPLNGLCAAKALDESALPGAVQEVSVTPKSFRLIWEGKNHD